MIIEILLIIATAFILTFLLKGATALILFGQNKYYLWLLAMAAMGFLAVYSSTFFAAGINVFSVAIVVSVFLFTSGQSKLSKEQSDEIYSAMIGVKKRGKLMHTAGVSVYALAALVTWIICYATITQ